MKKILDITIENFDIWQDKAEDKNYIAISDLKGQKAACFSPFANPVSSCRWNPLAEVRVGTKWEYWDTQKIAFSLFKDIGDGNDPTSCLMAFKLLTAVILHLIYKHQKESLPVPTFSTVASFLSQYPNDALREMYGYAHIPIEIFVPPSSIASAFMDSSEDKQPHVDLSAWQRPRNVLQDVYGEYVDFHCEPWHGMGISSFDDVPQAVLTEQVNGKRIIWPAEEDGLPSGQPWHLLVTHPKVRECAQNMLDCDDFLSERVFLLLRGLLSFFDNPVLNQNMSQPTFCIRECGKQLPSIFVKYNNKYDDFACETVFRLFLLFYYEAALDNCTLVKHEEKNKSSDGVYSWGYGSDKWYKSVQDYDAFSLMVDTFKNSCICVRSAHGERIEDWTFTSIAGGKGC